MVRMSLYASLFYKSVITSEAQTKLMKYAALMHDIGKIGIPDTILLKPGRLTTQEFHLMKNHTLIGARMLSNSKRDVIKMGYEIALNHHEKWDGSGYPSGLVGTKIPLSARVAAIADVFDALSTDRVYKKAYPIETCIEMMREQRNKHFEGELVDLFLSKMDEILMEKHMIDLRFQQPINEDVFSVIFNNSLII